MHSASSPARLSIGFKRQNKYSAGYVWQTVEKKPTTGSCLDIPMRTRRPRVVFRHSCENQKTNNRFVFRHYRENQKTNGSC